MDRILLNSTYLGYLVVTGYHTLLQFKQLYIMDRILFNSTYLGYLVVTEYHTLL